ncbi:unnamed protein product [Peronospora destructor]|uniref:Uncharacterized protein n=1 Tax=Peronospora destructor TaxID=86335 RepID=A0AAV0TTI7_9STRA|nr:unnamed protein product [Peronospora destructor]
MAQPDDSSSTTRHGSDRVFRCHRDLIRLYSTFTRRSNSIISNTSSIVSYKNQHLSQHDLVVLKQKFQFIRDDDDDAEKGQTDWQIRMSVRYYQQLFREYALADLSRYKEGKIGLRWRTDMEVVAGTGQFSCGNKQCDERAGLHSYELLFAYVEHGERKRDEEEKGSGERESENDGKWKKGLDTRKEKRRRLSMSYRDMDNCGEIADGLDDVNERKERWAANDELDAECDKGIHELCAKINAEQNAAYSRDLDQPKNEFEELLP